MANNEKWLNSLKPGDKVFCSNTTTSCIKTVERLTPTGRIILKGHPGVFIDGVRGIDSLDQERITEPINLIIKNVDPFSRALLYKVIDEENKCKTLADALSLVMYEYYEKKEIDTNETNDIQ